MKKELHAYLRTIHTLCPPKQRRRFVHDLQNDILQFQEANPDCDIHMVITRFGTPTEIAASFVRNYSDNKTTTRKRQAVFLIALVAIIALIIGSTALALCISDAYSDSHIQRTHTNQEDDYYGNAKID